MFLWVKVKPNAKVTKVTKWLDEKTVEIAIHAPPKEGKANAELIRFLADKLDTSKTSISIVSGTMAKLKRVELPDSAKIDALREDQPRLL
ncbi:MAG: DUF167 domain-containing protein [Patescibacteria group bacterium]|jgi:hypothetical protein